MNPPAGYEPKHFTVGDKVVVTDIKGIGVVREIHNKLLWVKFRRKPKLEPVLYLNAHHVV